MVRRRGSISIFLRIVRTAEPIGSHYILTSMEIHKSLGQNRHKSDILEIRLGLISLLFLKNDLFDDTFSHSPPMAPGCMIARILGAIFNLQ